MLKSLQILKSRVKTPFSRFIISGESMDPTLKNGQTAISLNWFFKIYKNDLVVAEKNGKLIIKRVTKILNNKYFLQGDNKSFSTDSRKFGYLSKDDIFGKVILTY